MEISHFSQELFLRDGTPVLIRAIRPDDKQHLSEGFHHLSGQSIYFRFFRRKKDLTEDELRDLTEVDFNHHVAIVVTLLNRGEEDGIGVGRYIELKDNDSERVAEIAFAVEDEFQGLGVGTILLEQLTIFAQQQGIKRLVADVLLDNKAMMRMLKNCGFNLETTVDNGIAHIEFNI